MHRWTKLLAALTLVGLLVAAVGVSTNTAAQSPRPAQLAQGVQPLGKVAQITVPTLDVAKLRAEAQAQPKPGAARFAEAAPVNITPFNSGTTENLPNGDMVWRIRLAGPNALSLNLGWTRYLLSPNARLFLYPPDYSTVLGAFTAADNEQHGQFWSPIVVGSAVVVELQAPAAEWNSIALELTAVNRGFTGFGLPREKSPTSGACNIDVVCPEGNAWRDDIRSVGVYTIGGLLACTGALVNNTARNLTPYFLTANHCLSSAAEAATVVTYFNYQTLLCRTGTPGNDDSGGPLPPTFITGATMRATYDDSDFTLLELDDPLPESYAPHWAGWDAGPQASTSAVAIHHPQGDEKRISFENNPTEINSYGGTGPAPGNGTHVRVVDWDLGTTEPGSSGSPLFDQNQRIIGQLHGGGAACGNDLSDYYGRLHISWNGGGSATNRLKDWLDPGNTGATALDGQDARPNFNLDVIPTEQAVCAPSNALFTVNLTVTQGYSTPVTLAATGVPAGATATFNLNPVTPPGSSVLTIGNTGAAATGTYTVSVVGSAATDIHTDTAILRLADAAPVAPTLLAPANNANGVDVRPNFSWNSSAQAASYRLEISSDANFTTVVYSATVATTNHTITSDLAGGTRYYWRVRASNGCGNSAFSATRSFITATGPDSCDVGDTAVAVQSYDFEAGLGDWTHGITDSWAISSTVAHSGTNSVHAATPAVVSNQWLQSPPITLPSDQAPLTLQFWNHQTIEDNNVTACYDGAILEISDNGGTDWTQVTDAALLTDPYDGPVSSNFRNPLAGRQAWCGNPQDWINSVVDLDTYAGETVAFRFRLGTDTSQAREGWYIDDVKVQACTADSVYLPLVLK